MRILRRSSTRPSSRAILLLPNAPLRSFPKNAATSRPTATSRRPRFRASLAMTSTGAPGYPTLSRSPRRGTTPWSRRRGSCASILTIPTRSCSSPRSRLVRAGSTTTPCGFSKASASRSVPPTSSRWPTPRSRRSRRTRTAPRSLRVSWRWRQRWGLAFPTRTCAVSSGATSAAIFPC